ncbi:MAG: triose-phosphate isomerase [Silvanigrellales bacterium]|nr:triose-phosphate isomerase [Silvanigrellales bacterium]
MTSKTSPIRRKLVVGNWKMNKALGEGRDAFLAFEELTRTLQSDVDVGLALPALMLPEVALRRRHVRLYAQNVHWAKNGAFTGETPASHLAELSLSGSLVAHSERRQMNGETDATAGGRIAALLDSGLEAVFCVGETLVERESGRLKEVLTRQLEGAFTSAGLGRPDRALGADPNSPLLSVAYEPVWAIGTGKAATPVEAQEAHAFLRGELTRLWGQEAAARTRLLYGGSVTPANATAFFGCADIDGALVGGASLDPRGFADLCAQARMAAGK